MLRKSEREHHASGGPRGRRRYAAVIATAGLAALGILAVTAPSDEPRGAGDGWSLERIRSEGGPSTRMRHAGPGHGRLTESGIRVREYVVCDGPPSVCENDPPLREPYIRAALEVAQEGRSALFDLSRDEVYWAAEFDSDTLFVMDDPAGSLNHPGRRHRLLRADGSEVRLRLLDDPAPAVPGPGVFVIDHGIHAGERGVEDVYLVDEHQGTLRPLDVPRLGGPESLTSRDWGPNVEEFLWAVDRDCRVLWARDGGVERRRAGCASRRRGPTYMKDRWFPAGWLRPGRMALAERRAGRRVLHVTLDYGRTWRRIPVAGEAAIPGALRRLG